VRYPDRQPDMAPVFERGLAIARQHNDLHEIAFYQRLLGHWYSHSKYNQEVGIPLLEESLKTFQSLNDDYYAAIVLDDLGWSHALTFQKQRQIEIIQQCLTLRRKINDRIGIANALRNMGGAEGGYGTASDEPLRYWQEALQLAKELEDRSSIAWNMYLISAFWVFRGEFEKSRPLLDEALHIATEINERTIKGLCLIDNGIYAGLIKEDYEQARRLYKEGYPEGGAGDLREMNGFLLDMIIGCGTGDYIAMKKRFLEQEWVIFRDTSRAPLIMPFVACLIAHFGEIILAAELLGGAYASNYYYPIPTLNDWSVQKQLRAKLETELGAENYQAALKRGEIRDAQELMSAAREVISNTN
jgi:hypothetical protein